MQRTSWPRRSSFNPNSVETIETEQSSQQESLTPNSSFDRASNIALNQMNSNSLSSHEDRTKTSAMRRGVLDASSRGEGFKNNKPNVSNSTKSAHGPNKIASALNRARENASNVSAKASTMVEGAKLHAKLQIALAAEAASLSASQMAASARESADAMGKAARDGAASAKERSTYVNTNGVAIVVNDFISGGGSNNTSRNGFPRSALKGSRQKEILSKLNHNRQHIVGTGAPPRKSSITASSSSWTDGISTSPITPPPFENTSSSPLQTMFKGLNHDDAGEEHSNDHRVWFTEKVKVHCYDPYVAVQPRRFGSGGGAGLSLDAFMARRPKPTYTALSREGKEGILKVPAPFIRGRMKRKIKKKNRKVVDQDKSSNTVTEAINTVEGIPPSSSRNNHDESGVNGSFDGVGLGGLLGDESQLRDLAGEVEGGGGMWQGLVTQWLKTTKGTSENSFMLNRMMHENGRPNDNESQPFQDKSDDETNSASTRTSGTSHGVNSLGYDSEGSTFSWMSDDSSKSNNSRRSHYEEENEDGETVLSDNEDGVGDSVLLHAEGRVNSGSDKWERRMRARDRWWQRVAILSSSHKESASNGVTNNSSHPSSNSHSPSNTSSTVVLPANHRDNIIDGMKQDGNRHNTSRENRRRSSSHRSETGSDYSTDTDGSDWGGRGGSGGYNSQESDLEEDNENHHHHHRERRSKSEGDHRSKRSHSECEKERRKEEMEEVDAELRRLSNDPVDNANTTSDSNMINATTAASGGSSSGGGGNASHVGVGGNSNNSTSFTHDSWKGGKRSSFSTSNTSSSSGINNSNTTDSSSNNSQPSLSKVEAMKRAVNQAVQEARQRGIDIKKLGPKLPKKPVVASWRNMASGGGGTTTHEVCSRHRGTWSTSFRNKPGEMFENMISKASDDGHDEILLSETQNTVTSLLEKASSFNQLENNHKINASSSQNFDALFSITTPLKTIWNILKLVFSWSLIPISSLWDLVYGHLVFLTANHPLTTLFMMIVTLPLFSFLFIRWNLQFAFEPLIETLKRRGVLP